MWSRYTARATSLAAARFLDSLLIAHRFPIKALQVDGGSEFAAEFERPCLQKELPLFVLPPNHEAAMPHVGTIESYHNDDFY